MNVLLAGDTHRNYEHIDYLIVEAQRHDASLIVQLGDFGFLWREDGIVGVEQRLAKAGIHLLWIDGNHENFDMLADKYGTSPQDLVPTECSEHVTYLPRGHVFDLAGLRCMAFGGAISIDKAWRTEGRSWWAQEAITDLEVDYACGQGRVDIMLTHDAPECPAALDMYLRSVPILGGSEEGYKLDAESRENRERLRTVYDAVTPALVVHGHYHHFYLGELEHGRVVGLNCDGSGRGSYLVLDTDEFRKGQAA